MTDTAPPGLCMRCSRSRKLHNERGSVFWLCLEHDNDPSWPKYPRLPVLTCSRHLAVDPNCPGPSGRRTIDE